MTTTAAPAPLADDVESARRLVRRALVGAVALVGLVWLPVLVLWSGAPFAVTFDDAYYYFEIARHLAAGDGSSFDGLTSTNGYHPLWLLVCVPVFVAGLDGLAAVRTLLVLQLGCWLVTLLVLSRTVARSIDAWPRLVGEHRTVAVRTATAAVVAALVLVAANPFVLKLFVNGLESGPASLVGALLLARACADRGHLVAGGDRHLLATGGLLALAIVARTDAVLLVGAVAVWSLPDWWAGGRRLRPALAVFGPPAVALGLLTVVNQVAFGTWTQVSGDVKRLDLTPGRAVAVLAVGLTALALLALTRRRRDRTGGRLPRTAAVLGATGWYGATCVLVVGYYAVLSAQQWLWYYAPVALWGLLLLLVLVADLVEGAVAEAPDRAPTRAMAPVLAIVAAPLLVGFAYQAVQIADPHQRSIQEANRDAGRWISTNLPSDAVLASWDAGVVGYFTDQPVVNLDGVVNDAEWAATTDPAERAARLDALGVGWIVNHGASVDGADPTIVPAAAQVLPDVGLETVHEQRFTYSGTTTQDRSSGLKAMAVYVYRLQPAPG